MLHPSLALQAGTFYAFFVFFLAFFLGALLAAAAFGFLAGASFFFLPKMASQPSSKPLVSARPMRMILTNTPPTDAPEIRAASLAAGCPASAVRRNTSNRS